MKACASEAEMTHDRRFKKRVRALIAKTGETYMTAYRHPRTAEGSRMTEIIDYSS